MKQNLSLVSKDYDNAVKAYSKLVDIAGWRMRGKLADAQFKAGQYKEAYQELLKFSQYEKFESSLFRLEHEICTMEKNKHVDQETLRKFKDMRAKTKEKIASFK